MLSEQQLAEIHAYLDGELPADKCASVEALLSESADAKQALEDAQALKQSMASAEAPKPNVDAAWQNFSKQIEAPTPRKKIIPFIVPLGAVAAVFAFALIIWFSTVNPPASTLPTSVELVGTDLEESSAIVYIDDISGWAVVWIDTEEVTEEEPAG